MVETIKKYFERLEGRAISIEQLSPTICGGDFPNLMFESNEKLITFKDEFDSVHPYSIPIESINNAEFGANNVTIYGLHYIVTIAES